MRHSNAARSPAPVAGARDNGQIINYRNGAKSSKPEPDRQQRRGAPTVIETRWRAPIDKLLGEYSRRQLDHLRADYGAQRLRRLPAEVLEGLTAREGRDLARLLGAPLLRRALAKRGIAR
jgi:hypothetical protein